MADTGPEALSLAGAFPGAVAATNGMTDQVPNRNFRLGVKGVSCGLECRC